MAASTTVKVAVQTGAAKDDNIAAAATGLTEDRLTASLNVLANDPGSAKLYSLGQSLTNLNDPAIQSVVLPSGARISISNGMIAYDGSSLRGGLQPLAEGELFADTFTYTIRMANGALSVATVRVEIGGTNDVPTLAAVSPGTIFDTAADDLPAAVTGVLKGADVDHGAVLTYGFAGLGYVIDGNNAVMSNAYGTLTVNRATGAYSFQADPDKIDALNAGEVATASFQVTVTDEHGAAAAPVTVAFNLVGANDTATVVVVDTKDGAVAEDGTTSAGGSLQVFDRDAGQSLFAAVDANALHGAYGDFSFTAAGAWSYALRNDDANVQALRGGQQVVESLVVSSLDGTATEVIQVTVTGTNDAASISVAGGNTGAVVEDAAATVGGRLAISDVDAGEAVFAAVDAAALQGVYGDFAFDGESGAWSYSLRNGAANVQALGADDHLVESLVVRSLDGTATATISVDVFGAAEPVVTPPAGGGQASSGDTFRVNHGQTDINGRQIFTDFGADDRLVYSNNYEFKGWSPLDFDGNGSLESTGAVFDFQRGNGRTDRVTVVLVGYTGLTANQVTTGGLG